MHFTWHFIKTVTRPDRVSFDRKNLIDNVWIKKLDAVENSGVILSGMPCQNITLFNNLATYEFI